MYPEPELVGNSEKGNDAYCLAGENLLVLALPDGGSCKIPAGEGPRTIQWFNPRNGEIQKATPLKSTKITSPDKNDWIAIVRAN